MSDESTLVPCVEIAGDHPNSVSSLVWYPANRSRCCRSWVMVGGVSRAPEISMSIQARLKDKSLLREQAFIGGAWVSADDGGTISVINPATGAEVGTVPALGAMEARRASWRRKRPGPPGVHCPVASAGIFSRHGTIS
jgi:hypothetical protein